MDTKTRNLNLRGIAFALAALTATVPSLALAGGEAVTEHVYYNDLNLATEAGVTALDRRLDRAVERVCGTPQIRSLRSEQQIARCREDTWQSIRDDREVAIARATGQDGSRSLADNSPRGAARVTLAD